MEQIRILMIQLIVVVFLTALLDLLLPNSTFRNEIKMFMGIFTVFLILQPATQLLQIDYRAVVEQKIEYVLQQCQFDVWNLKGGIGHESIVE